MLARLRAKRENDKGFTLIELLLVIVILGILAAVVVFSVRGISDRGNESACDAAVNSVQTASEAFFAQTGGYPGALGDLITGGYLNNPGSVTGNAISGGSWTVTFVPGASGAAPTVTRTDCA